MRRRHSLQDTFLAQQNSGSTSRISRREFGRRAALTGAAALLPADLVVHAQQEPIPSDKREPSGTAQAELSSAARGEIESRYQNLVRKWGQRITPEQKRRLRRILTENERMLQPIRAFQLVNGDPPAPVLRFAGDEVNGERPTSNKATDARR
jgi:hypothetical protein